MCAVKSTESAAQALFEATYVTASQIMRELGISRSALLYARKRGVLPDPIIINEGRLYIWQRKDVQANINAWKRMLDIRKGV
jgi:hypothetical protein